MEKKIYVNFVIKTDEALRLECQNGPNRAEREIFIVDEKFYFYYVMNKNASTVTLSLREITKEEYLARKAEILSCPPDCNTREWIKDENKYNLRIFHFGTWRRNMAADDCIFITENNRVKDLADSVVAQVTQQRDAEVTLDKESKTEYARKCGGLSVKLGISFVNAMRIGPEKGKLVQFKESYQRALIKAQAISLREQRQLYNMINGGRKARTEAMNLLGVKFFDADVNLMDFEELTQNLWRSLSAYSEQSVKSAIRTGIEMDYHTRLEIFQKLRNNSRELRREALTQLGVEVDVIEFKRYPTDHIAKELGATLGMDMEI